MNDNYLGYYKSSAFISLVALLAIALFLARDYWELSISITAVVGILVYSINQKLWKYRPFIWLFRVKDFSGRYEGYLEYEYRDEKNQIKKGRLKHIKIIYQSGTKIKIDSFTIESDGSSSSQSTNMGMFVENLDDGKHFKLIYNYLNEGNTQKNLPLHYGTEILKFIEGENETILTGKYFTERHPFQTKGTFSKLIKVSNNLEHIF